MFEYNNKVSIRDFTVSLNFKIVVKIHYFYIIYFYFLLQRELENNPLIVIKDMQFNVLQALIEFMYYGETRITEENLTSLIEAAKLFEVRFFFFVIKKCI